MADKLINESETIVRMPVREVLGVPYVILPTGLVKYDQLTAADINHYAVVTSPDHANAGGGGNISCAIVSDGLTLGFSDSEEDDERTLCEPGNSVNLTDKNFDDDLVGFRDKDKSDETSVFNLWTRLTFAPDVPYLDVYRTDKPSDAPFVAGDEIDAFYVHTDLPLNVHDDGGKQKVQSTAVPKSIALDGYVLSA